MILVLITIFANIVIICKGCLINSNDFYISVKKSESFVQIRSVTAFFCCYLSLMVTECLNIDYKKTSKR